MVHYRDGEGHNIATKVYPPNWQPPPLNNSCPLRTVIVTMNVHGCNLTIKFIGPVQI